MRNIRLKLAGTTSRVVVGVGAYESLEALIDEAGLGPAFLVVTQPRIMAALGRRPPGGNPVHLIPDGERAKNLGTVKRLLDRMVELGLDRQSTLVALGGGVVGDVAGFTASLYMRGIPVAQVPTTLLAQVDSSIGGKTGVNHPAGKNLIGTFHQPKLVVVDPLLLASLPAREYRSGLYEAIKYGIIRDRPLFDRFERKLSSIIDRDPSALAPLIGRCLQVKASVVRADERESNLRRILNFGHTIGHAIEAATGYRRLRHGEAVGYGMIGATWIARRMGLVAEPAAERIEAGVRSIGPLPALPGVGVDAIMEAMTHDKKARGGRLHFVLPRSIGEVTIAGDVPRRLVRGVVKDLFAT